MAMVDGWCRAALENASLGAGRSLMRAYRAACHYGDSEEEQQVDESMRIASSAVYNKLLLFVLVGGWVERCCSGGGFNGPWGAGRGMPIGLAMVVP